MELFTTIEPLQPKGRLFFLYNMILYLKSCYKYVNNLSFI